MIRRFSLLLGAALALAISGADAAETAIGFANPLTGRYAATGGRNWAAVELALQDLNAAGGVLGHEVGLFAVDDGCGVEQAVAAAQQLVASGVPVVIGHMCSHSSLVAAGIYEVANVIMITPSSTHPRLTEEGRHNVFRLIGRDDRQGSLAGDLLAARWSGRRIAILHDGSAYGEGLAAETRRRLQQHRVREVLYEAYAPGAADYAAVVARLREVGAEVLYIGGYGPDAGLILRTAREQGLNLQLVGGDGLAMEEFWTVAGAAGEGTVFSDRPAVNELPAAQAVLARLRRQDLGEVPVGSLAAYAAVQVWAQAVERAMSLDPAAVSEMLHRGRFETVLGSVAFDAKGDLEGADWEWKTWSDGTQRPATFEPPRAAAEPTGRGLFSIR
jgi:branched-chain amino acid transport system substrate-binding protein